MLTHKRVNTVLAMFVFFFSAIVYLRTCGPTICLWDCGEYLAASACLGIPHPPGTPLLIPIGRVFFMALSFLKDAGFRLNLIAVFGSAFTVFFIYLIIVRVLIFVLGEPDTTWKRVSLYCGGLVGALFCAFSSTYWFCSLEASEQCNVCLLPVVITIWLALKWAQSTDPKRDRFLLLISYIGIAPGRSGSDRCPAPPRHRRPVPDARPRTRPWSSSTAWQPRTRRRRCRRT